MGTAFSGRARSARRDAKQSGKHRGRNSIVDPIRFDNWAKSLATEVSRRRILGGLLASVGGVIGLRQSVAAARCADKGQACATSGDCRGVLPCVNGICQPPGQSGGNGPGKGNGGGGSGGCPAGQTRCRGACVDLQTDLVNCGGCGAVCATGVANASPTCAGGGCGFVCNAGYADCDGLAANGCEVDTTGDVNNCGACGNVCTGGDQCNPVTCAMGQCGIRTGENAGGYCTLPSGAHGRCTPTGACCVGRGGLTRCGFGCCYPGDCCSGACNSYGACL